MLKTGLILLFLLATVLPGIAARTAPVVLLYIEGQIDPVTADYIADGIKKAEDGAQAVVIQMDTPGGLLSSTQKIIQAIFASKVPIIVYVAPNGATAASAGALITMVAHKAAMAPVSNIGSATPVALSPSGEVQKINKSMERKIVNDLAAKARAIAKERGRNVEWAEKAVREASNLTSKEALNQNVIDYIANDLPDLMRQLDGERVKVAGDKVVILKTADAPIEDRPMGPWETFLHYLSNPMVVLFLMLAATYGLIYELANPGAIFPGVIGAISIVLLLYSYSVLPVNVAGLVFIFLAIAMFVLDLFTPTHGVLTVGGAISLFLGLVMIFRSAEGFMVPIWLLLFVTLLTAGFFAFVISLGVRALKNPYVSGREGVVGLVGEARTDLNPTGKVFVDGSLWTATSVEGNILQGELVDVTEMSGLKLKVRKHKQV
ncbi:MAG: nodulation protein NfeD [Armatimonadetes bacterium]|nr:nodulation protein NfeD [Armatimonadota bacterium]